MPRLIHLNGPPGIGKSTLAALYADRHPGVLNLDVDTLHRLVGGWQDDAIDTWPAVWSLVRAMAAAHLAGGHDVILPQFHARADEIEGLAALAGRHGAGFREVVLLDDRAAVLDRFDRRGRDSDDPWIRHHHRLLEPAALGAMHDDLLAVVRGRPGTAVVRSAAGAVPETYELLVAALREPIEPGRWTAASVASVQIRAAGPADLDRCAELERGAYGDDAYSAMTMRQFLEVSGPLFAVAVAPGEPAVLGYILAAPSAESGLGWVLSVIVDEPARGRGVGRRLVTHTLTVGRALGLSRVRCTVSPGNSRSLALFRGLGFAEIGEDPDYFGRGESRKVFEVSLGDHSRA